jgi:transcriptional regulator GlxA family with amidase domain
MTLGFRPSARAKGEHLGMTLQRVAIVVHEGVQALDVAGPIDVFAEANGFVDPEDRYETYLVAATREPMRASNRMQITADLSFAEASGDFAIMLVAGGPGLPIADPDPAMSEWLQSAYRRSGLYGSICTGAFALGHAGLLDGHVVTTHWQNAQRLAALFPRANVELDRIHMRDGNLVTSAGVTAGIDLALAIVSERHGAEVALSVAKRLVVVAQRQGGQSQFSPFLTAPGNDNSPIVRIQIHVMAHIGKRHTMEELAAHVSMSTRNLARLFVQETGVTPHEFIERVRIDTARRLLEASDQALKAVAFDCGFGTADRMRAVFTRRLGITPAQYRMSFRYEAATG